MTNGESEWSAVGIPTTQGLGRWGGHILRTLMPRGTVLSDRTISTLYIVVPGSGMANAVELAHDDVSELELHAKLRTSIWDGF